VSIGPTPSRYVRAVSRRRNLGRGVPETGGSACVAIVAALLCSLCAGMAMAQEAPRSGLDVPRVRVCVPDFLLVGGGDVDPAAIAEALRRGLRAQAELQLVDSPEVRAAASQARDGLFSLEKGAARELGDKLGVDAVIYGTVVEQVAELLDEPAMLTTPLVQLAVVETLTLDGQLFPGEPLSLGADTASALTAQAQALLPAMGRVLSIIESPEGVSLQLFPLGGRVLAPDTVYGVFDALELVAVDQDAAKGDQALPPQDLRPARLTGRVRTDAEPSGHAVTATSIDPSGHVAVGQLVAVAPADETPAAPRLPLLLVHSAPPGAVVFVNGQVAGLTPMALHPKPDQKTAIIVAARNHFPADYEVSPGPDDAQMAMAPLREIPPIGSLRVATTPAGATVQMDGDGVGTTPLTVEQVAAGEHRLVVSLEGYKTVQRTVDVRRQRGADVELQLEKDFRRIQITSTPDGARAYLDGDEIGTTPLTVDAAQTGSHELRLSLAGHAPVKESIKVDPEETEQVLRFRLRALAGNINVQTTPPGATVTLDGQEKGKTPVALTNLAIGQHELIISLDGFLPVQRTVTVQDQQTATVQEDLAKAEGKIMCVSVPKGAMITLDGQEVGVTPRTIEQVPVGRRTLRLTLDGYEVWEAAVPVVHGETTKVEVALIRAEQAGLRRAQ